MVFVIEVKWLFPLYRDGGFRHFYFQELGKDFLDVVINVVSSPARAFVLLFQPAQKVNGLMIPFTSTSWLAWMSPAGLLTVVPGILERFGSTFANSWWGHHYGGPTHALTLCAAILGASRLKRWLVSSPLGSTAAPLRSAVALFPAMMVCASTVLVDTVGPWGATDLFVLRKPYHPSVEDRATMKAAVSAIPLDEAVAAQNYLLPHLAARKQIYMLNRAREAKFVAMTPSTNPWPYDRPYQEHLARELGAEGWLVYFCQGNSFVLAHMQGESVACPALGRP
jgi:hypothetical protein